MAGSSWAWRICTRGSQTWTPIIVTGAAWLFFFIINLFTFDHTSREVDTVGWGRSRVWDSDTSKGATAEVLPVENHQVWTSAARGVVIGEVKP